MLDNLIKIRKEHKMNVDVLNSVDFSNPETLLDVMSDMESEKVGLVVKSLFKMRKLQKQLQNFIMLKDEELEALNRELKEVVKDIENINR